MLRSRAILAYHLAWLGRASTSAKEIKMKVYGHPISTCTRKVLTTLAEKGHEAEFVMVDIMKGEQKQPGYLAKQPFGVVPLLEDDDFTLYESRAIIRYLDERLSGPALTPKDLKDRGRMEQFISIERSSFSPPAMKVIWNLMFKKMMGQEPDMDAVTQGKTEVSRTLDIVDKELATREFLAGSAFTLADITWMPYAQYLVASGEGALLTDRPNVGAWWKRVSGRSSWVRVAG
jgi:glutathione S-transferase